MKMWIAIATLMLAWIPQTATAALLDAPSGAEIAKGLKTDDTSWTAGTRGYGGSADGKWTYALGGGADWADYRVSCKLKLVTPATGRGGMEMGGFRWYYAMRDLGGYEAAVIVRHASEKQHYRVMVSSMWKELVLWRPTGGVVQVVGYPFQTGKDYALTVTCRGPQITVAVDGKPLIDWWDTAEPVLNGQVGLARKEGKSYFRNLKVESVGKPAGPAPAHKPNFTERQWHNLQYFFDGNEPIFVLTKKNDLDQMKFKPGYRAAMLTANYLCDRRRFYPTQITDSKVAESGTRLVLDVTSADPKTKSKIPMKSRVTVTYDAKTGMYVYDQRITLELPDDEAPKVAPVWDLGSPWFLGGAGWSQTRDPNPFRPLYTWSVWRADDGKYYKIPMNHNGYFLGTVNPGGGLLYLDGGEWVVLGDPIVNPLMRFPGLSDRYSRLKITHCNWDYEMHMQHEVRKVDDKIEPGTYTTRVLYTAMSGKKADALLAKAKFYKPKDVTVKIPVYTAGVGRVETFDKEVLLASPHTEYRIVAGVLDRAVGHGDTMSLRLDGASEAWTLTGPSYYTSAYGEKNRITYWVKTKDVTGEGPTIGLRTSDSSETAFYPSGITGTKDWTKVQFTFEPKNVRNWWGVFVHFRNSGSGTVWIDDFKIEPLDAGATVKEPAGVPYPIKPADPDLVLRWDGNGDNASFVDTSGYGHHGKVFGDAAWTGKGSRRALTLDGDTYVWPLPTQHLTPGVNSTMVFDLKPQGAGRLVAWGWDYSYKLAQDGSKFKFGYQRGNGRHVVWSKPLLNAGKWQRLAIVAHEKQIKLYVDGTFVEALTVDLVKGAWCQHVNTGYHPHPSLFGGGPGDMSLKNRRVHSCIKGQVGAVTIYKRALSADEIAKLGTR